MIGIVTFIIIIIVLYFIFKPDESNAKNTSNQPKYNDSNTSKNTFSQTPQRVNHSKKVDLKINGFDLVNGDLVKMKSGNTFIIKEKSTNGTFTGTNIKTNEKIALYASGQDRFILIDGIYVHEKVANHPRHDNKSSLKKNSLQASKNLLNDNVTCSRCQKRTSNNAKICTSCGWKLTNPYIHKKIRLAGVTHENRQNLIARMSIYDTLSIKRDQNNSYDPNAIGIYNSQNQSIGWIPKDVAANLAPAMDSGTELNVKILKKLGGNGYNFGLEVMVSNDIGKLKCTPVVEVNPTSTNKVSSYKFSNIDDEEADYIPTYHTSGYNDWEYDEYEKNTDYDDFDEEAQGWEDLWEYNQNH